MSLLTVTPIGGTFQNNGDLFYGWMGWKITTDVRPFKIMQVHVQPIYVAGPSKFAIFDHCPTDFTDESWLYASDFWMDDSENFYAPETPTANYTLSAYTSYYLAVRSTDSVTSMDYPFWDETVGLPMPTTGGYFTLDAAILENTIPSPASSWPFPGPIYEVTIETVVAPAIGGSPTSTDAPFWLLGGLL